MSNVYFVYLLIHQTEPRFKVGIASDPLIRLKQLPDKINLNESLMAKCLDKAHAFKVEKTLHFLFRSSQVENLPQRDGYTEWFDISVLDEVKDFCHRERTKLGLVTVFEPFPERNTYMEPRPYSVAKTSTKRNSYIEERQDSLFFHLLNVVRFLVERFFAHNEFLGVYEEANPLRNIVIVTMKDASFLGHEVFSGLALFAYVKTIEVDGDSDRVLYLMKLSYSFSDAQPGGGLCSFTDLWTTTNELRPFLMTDQEASFFRQFWNDKSGSYAEWFATEIQKSIDDRRNSVNHVDVVQEWEKEKSQLQLLLNSSKSLPDA